jgi:hypothetical protein
MQSFVLTSESLPGTHCKQTAVKPTCAKPVYLMTGEEDRGIGQIICMHICYDHIIPNNLYEGDVNKTELQQPKVIITVDSDLKSLVRK